MTHGESFNRWVFLFYTFGWLTFNVMANNKQSFNKDIQYYKFCLYGFLKNLEFFEAFQILFLLENGLTFLQIGFFTASAKLQGTSLKFLQALFLIHSDGEKPSCFHLYFISSVF